MVVKKVLVVYAKPYTSEQRKTFDKVKKFLKKKVKVAYMDRMKLIPLRFKGKDLIIAVGGDGTFLRACQFIENTPIMGINSDLKNKEGFYMRLNYNNFESRLNKILKGDFKTAKLLRLGAKINKKEIGCMALNEFYFGAEKSYMTARYKIKIKDKEESQRSSGIIASTPTGTRAWAKAIGGKVLPRDFNGYSFTVREPFEHKIFKNYKFNKGVVKTGNNIKLKSQMEKGILVADSVSIERKIKYNDVITIGISKNFVRAVI